MENQEKVSYVLEIETYLGHIEVPTHPFLLP